jgi:hypothetical protein
MLIALDRIQQVMRYAVAVAANADDFKRRELGPIHLLKYVYLADLAHAEKHGGQTYTGIPWRFHHFGPWAQEAWQQIPAAMALGSICQCSFQSADQADRVRWRSKEPELEGKLESSLPHEVSRAVKLVVKDLGNDTYGLLHHVYSTLPMRKAAPEEPLDFSMATAEPEELTLPPEGEPPQEQLSKTARKRRQQAHDALRLRFQETLKKRRQRRAQPTVEPVQKTADLMEVLEWVDSLAGEPMEPLKGELIVSDDIWKSPARSRS